MFQVESSGEAAYSDREHCQREERSVSVVLAWRDCCDRSACAKSEAS